MNIKGLLNLKAKSRFYADLARYIKSGIGINRAIDETGTSLPVNTKKVFLSCIESGNFSKLERPEFNEWFSNTDIKMFKMASETGDWVVFLESLSNINKKFEENITHTVMALAYPVFLLHMLFILPNLSVWFLKGLPAFLYKVCFNLGILYAILITLFLFSKRFYFLGVKLPFLGTLMKDIVYSRLLFILSITLESGISITKSISFCDDIVSSFPPFQSKFSRVKKYIDSGKSISDSFKRVHFFPVPIQTSINSGEKSGSLPEIMKRESEVLEQSIDNRLKSGIKILGIVVYLAVAVAIGYKVISTFSATLVPGDLLN